MAYWLSQLQEGCLPSIENKRDEPEKYPLASALPQSRHFLINFGPSSFNSLRISIHMSRLIMNSSRLNAVNFLL